MYRHLDSQEVDQWLVGERNPAAEDHLRDCAECRSEVARLESALTGFCNSTQQWSARQPLSRPRAGWAARSVTGRRWPTPMRWVAVAALAVLLAALPLYRNYSRRQATAEAKANALLLEQVSADISRPAPVPLEPLIRLVSQSTSGDNQ
jgi:hypothetical protein